MPMRRFSFPLVVHLSTLFGLLTIVTVVALTWLRYQRMVDLAEANGKALAEQSAAEVSQAVDIVFAPVELVTALIGEHQVNDETRLEGRFRHFPLIRSAPDVLPPIDSYFIGI